MKAVLAGLVALAAAGVAEAAPECAVPETIPMPHFEGARPDQPARTVPITRYTLAIIWTPQHCRHAVPGADAFECGGAEGARFVLHGLWPDGAGNSWPQWCQPADILRPATIRAHFCATPSAQLLQHEWAKHGTCMAGYTPDRFFALSNRLFAALHFPNMAALARRDGLTADDIASAFAAANPGVPAEGLRVSLDREGWLQEVWFCLDDRLKAGTCPAEQPGAKGGRPARIALP